MFRYWPGRTEVVCIVISSPSLHLSEFNQISDLRSEMFYYIQQKPSQCLFEKYSSSSCFTLTHWGQHLQIIVSLSHLHLQVLTDLLLTEPLLGSGDLSHPVTLGDFRYLKSYSLHSIQFCEIESIFPSVLSVYFYIKVLFSLIKIGNFKMYLSFCGVFQFKTDLPS